MDVLLLLLMAKIGQPRDELVIGAALGRFVACLNISTVQDNSAYMTLKESLLTMAQERARRINLVQVVLALLSAIYYSMDGNTWLAHLLII